MRPNSWSLWLTRQFQKQARSRHLAQRRLAIDTLEDRTVPSTVTWTGGGGADHHWSNAANWGGVAVTANADLVFGAAAQKVADNDLNGLAIHSITVSAAGYSLTGKAITLGGNFTLGNGASGETDSINLALERVVVVHGRLGGRPDG